MHPITIINEIASAKTTKTKEAIIVANKDNTKLQVAVETALNTMLTFHTKKLNFIPPKASLFSSGQAAGKKFEDFISMLHRLDAKGSCDNNDQMWLDEIYSALSDEDQQLCDMIVSRSISCGAGLSKWRIAFGEDFLPDFPCYLSSAFDEDLINKHIFKNGTAKAFSDIKTDGQRCEAIVTYTKDGADVRLYSRQGKKYIGLNDLEMEIMLSSTNLRSQLSTLEGAERGYVLDGELVVVDDNQVIEPRSTGNGKISKFIKGKGDPVVGSYITFIVWDIIPLDEFERITKPSVPYYSRRQALHQMMHDWTGGTKEDTRLWLQESVLVDDIGGAIDHYAEAIKRGEEGTILKEYAGVWDPCPNKKRPTSQFKFKEVFQNEFKIVGWYYGEKGKKYANAIGGFKIESSCGKVVSNCGGGLSDEIRFDANPDGFIGCIITASFNALSEAKGRDTLSLCHPRLEEVREDKTEADSLEKIYEDIEATRQMRKLMCKK